MLPAPHSLRMAPRQPLVRMCQSSDPCEFKAGQWLLNGLNSLQCATEACLAAAGHTSHGVGCRLASYNAPTALGESRIVCLAVQAHAAAAVGLVKRHDPASSAVELRPPRERVYHDSFPDQVAELVRVGVRHLQAADLLLRRPRWSADIAKHGRRRREGLCCWCP